MSRIIRRTAAIEQTGNREFEAIAATSELQVDGIALVMAGANLARFARGNGPLLFQHDPDAILGIVTEVRTTSDTLRIRGRFSSPGVSDLADQRYRELKDGVLNSLSAGFSIDESEPIRGNPGAVLATAWTLIEVSMTATPIDLDAVVTSRSATRRERLAERARRLGLSIPVPDMCR